MPLKHTRKEVKKERMFIITFATRDKGVDAEILTRALFQNLPQIAFSAQAIELTGATITYKKPK